MSSDAILDEARNLPLDQKIEVCQALWNQILLSSELTPGEADLIDQRLREHLDDPSDVVPLADLQARLDRKNPQK